VEDIDLFVTLNVATFKNILCIPIVCKYFIFVVSMEMRGKNQSHVAVRYFIIGITNIKLLLENAGNNEENNCKPDHNCSELLGHWVVKDK
jgi:hypothetical protein